MLDSLTAADFVAACVQKGSEVCAQPSSVSQDHFAAILGSITTGFVSLLTFLGIVARVLLSRSRRTLDAAEAGRGHASDASFGINNHHKKNFRDDFDDFKENVFRSLGELKGQVNSLNGRMDNVDNTREREARRHD